MYRAWIVSEPVNVAAGTAGARAPLSVETAEAAARIMQAMASPVRLRILDRLWRSPCSVGELVTSVDMEQAAVSNHLRVLRHLDLVTGRRNGRQIIYALHDAHVAVLLEQALEHVEHLAGAGPAEDPAARE